MPLNVRVTENRPSMRTIALDGRLDNNSVGLLDAEIQTVIDSPVTVVVFDLAGLEYISSIGLRSIFRTRKVMNGRGGQVLLVNARPPVQKVLEIVNAVDIAAVFASVRELDAYLDAMQRKVTEGGS